jgi:hypothetical protein
MLVLYTMSIVLSNPIVCSDFKQLLKNGIMKCVKELVNSSIKLSDFPPQLRRVAEVMTNSVEFTSLKTACELANVNYDSARTMISRYRKRGIDFTEYVSSKSIELLQKGKYDVCRSLRSNAISGASADRKLFFQLTGDLVDKHQIDHNVKGLFAVFSGSTIPEDYEEKRKQVKPDGVQVIDIDLID